MRPQPERKPLQPHPYAALFPMMPEEELIALADDIRQHGQKLAIVVNADDLIIDGRNRAVACRMAGVDPVIDALPLDDREVLQYVVSANVHRRHLTESQRADIAARIANVSHGGDRKSKPRRTPETDTDQAANLPLDPPVTQEVAAELLNVSERSVRSAAKVQKQGGKALQAAVTAGDVSVSQAAKIADLPKAQQPAAVKQAKAPRPRKPSGLAPYDAPRPDREFDVDAASGRLTQLLRDELSRWPAEHLATAAYWVRAVLTEMNL